MQTRSPVECVFEDHEVMDEIRDIVERGDMLDRLEQLDDGRAKAKAYLETSRPSDAADDTTEAIVLTNGRPSLLIQQGEFEAPRLQAWARRLEPNRAVIEQAIQSVGRVELLRHPRFEWVGTGFLVAENLVVTNRHVAEEFTRRDGAGFTFASSPSGGVIGVRLDFLEEHHPGGVTPEQELRIDDVLFVAGRGFGEPDMAVLRIARSDLLPDPLTLAERDAEVHELVGVIGYPARDSRNGFFAQQRIFNDIFDVKRFAPGQLTSQSSVMQHDCTTLGGNSGSPIIQLSTGRVVGLHFGGRFRVSNFAVPVSTVRRILDQVTPISITVPPNVPTENLDDREGYDESFLGSGAFDLEVPLPSLDSARKADALLVSRGEQGMARFALPYTHFSIVMSQSRRFAIYTAVNIDGNQEVRIRRSRGFRLDPRIPEDAQVGEALYRRNPLDRGHLVRRLDPVWGPTDVARRAERDSFFFTNVAPQHARFNQRVWLELEDHLLTNANNRDLKISVFTGPIFGCDDPVHRGVRIPADYWKVVAMVTPAGQLHATAYMLSQNRLIDDLEFVFGRFRTFQVPISRIEQETGIQFGPLVAVDPMGSIEGLDYRPLNEPGDILM